MDFDLRYNISALVIAILRSDIHTPEQAFAVISDKRLVNSGDHITLEMIDLRESGMTYKAIGQIYGISETGAFNRIKYYKRRIGIAK